MQAASVFGFREVVSHRSVFKKGRDITINTGAAQGILQDIKRPEACGGYAFADSNSGHVSCCNRFIYWRISHDVLEISEVSLDVELSDNHISLRFQGTPILGGVHICEDGTNSVVMLVPTVSSVHRIIFPHPYKLTRQSRSLSTSHCTIPSIFSELVAAHLRDPAHFYVLNLSCAPGMLPHASSCWLSTNGEAHFTLAYSEGSIFHVVLPHPESSGSASVYELRKSTVIQRVLSGIVPSVMRSGSQANDAPISLCLHAVDQALLLFVLCRDCRIRMWSMQEHECLLEHSLTRYLGDYSHGSRLPQTGQHHILKKSAGIGGGEPLLVAYLHFCDRRHFVVLQLIQDGAFYDLAHLTTLYGPEAYDLTDFILTPNRLWALWSTVDSDPVLCYTTIDVELEQSSCWSYATLEPPVGRDFRFADGLMDPREAYCEHIFYPGRFSATTINKAIIIFRRAVDSGCISDLGGLSCNNLREEVTAAVETELQNHANEYELSDDVYLQLQQECWSKFYLGCVQYHQVETKAMGLFVDANTELICLIKKSCFSVLRLRDVVEFFISLPDIENDSLDLPQTLICAGKNLFENTSGTDLVRDVRALFCCLRVVRSKYSVELVDDFKSDMLHLVNPETIAAVVAECLMNARCHGKTEKSAMITELKTVLQTIKGIASAIQVVLTAIDVAHTAFSCADGSSGKGHAIGDLFASQLGASYLAESVHQLAVVRFEVCRDLLVFLVLLWKAGVELDMSAQTLEVLHTDFIPQTALFTQSYFVVSWVCETVASSVSSDILEIGNRQLGVLNLTDFLQIPTQSFLNECHRLRLIEMFIQGDGGTVAREKLSQLGILDNVPCKLWSSAFLPLVSVVLQQVWPITAEFLLPEFMLVNCQFTQLQEYVHLLLPWCEMNSFSRKFACGYSHLLQGEPCKALEWFQSAASGVHQEEYLVLKLLRAVDIDPLELVVTFYMKIIRLFEQCLDAEHVIALAKEAIDVAGVDSSFCPALYTLLFKHHLDLGHYMDAYAALVANSDQERKKNCLRQFVVVLFERRQLRSLIEFPYKHLHDEVVDILESKARTIDLNVHNYYEVLFAFHTVQGNFRRAGSVMYEYGMRLGNETGGLKGLQRQAKCYLASMNCLRMVDPAYAWIVRPVLETKEDASDSLTISLKRSYDGEEVPQPKEDRKVALVELEDIRLEYELVFARLQLIKCNMDPDTASGPGFTAVETAALLSKAGLYDAALRMCKIFRCPMEPVLETLAKKCVSLMRAVAPDPSVAAEAWDWLAENDVPRCDSARDDSGADHAWLLLQSYLERLEGEGRSVGLHRCVAVALFSLGARLPNWLIAVYKRRDVSDLLRLYLRFGLLEDAVRLTLEYVAALMGQGAEYFDLDASLDSGTHLVWMPYTAIDNLLETLSNKANDPLLATLNDTLREKLAEYHSQVERATEAIVHTKVFSSGVAKVTERC